FIRVLDNMGSPAGRDPDYTRLAGSQQSDAIRNITGAVDFAAKSNQASNYGGSTRGAIRTWVEAYSAPSHSGSDAWVVWNFDASRQVPTASENRPRNIAMLTCQKL
ncbi:MAG: hypothetical protein AB7E52_05680, partial [Bdellovibrionales bacterium]